MTKWEQGWCSGECTHLPHQCGWDTEFVVGSLPWSVRFISRYSSFLSNSTRNGQGRTNDFVIVLALSYIIILQLICISYKYYIFVTYPSLKYFNYQVRACKRDIQRTSVLKPFFSVQRVQKFY